ncbi:MAG TPA: hypothetical protein VLZ50_12090 [Terracidiphilus sp.]|nr:hypothetical protein [Terracidiphilus sp.]
MKTDFAEEWQRLTRHYAQMCDEELRQLASQFGDLTEMAQQVLRDEMRKRKLDDPGDPREPDGPREGVRRRGESRDATSQGLVSPPQWDTALALPAEDDETEEEVHGHEYTWKTLLCECDTKEEAWQIYEVLRRAGIESWIETPRSYALKLTGPRVVVAADQLDEASRIAAQPIPQEIVEESKLKVPEFEAPRCPKCGASDPVLESVDPSNTWSCECCGHEWAEAAENSKGRS